MSIITLKSKAIANNDNNTAPALFQNEFRDGITFRENDTITLVSLTLTKNNIYNVDDTNDTIVWRIGARSTYDQHIAKIQHGSYGVDGLAKAVQDALNNSTIIGVYKDAPDTSVAPDPTFGWKCEIAYDATTGAPKLKITNVQQTLPVVEAGKISTSLNARVYSSSSETPATLTENDDESTTIGNTGLGIDVQNEDISQIFVAEPPIFGNGGSFSIDIKPIHGIENGDKFSNIITAPDVQHVVKPQNIPGNTWFTDDRSVIITAYTGGHGWDWELNGLMDATDTTLTTYYLIFIGTDQGDHNGIVGMSATETALPDDPTTWDAPKPLWFFEGDEIVENAFGAANVNGNIISLDDPSLLDPVTNKPLGFPSASQRTSDDTGMFEIAAFDPATSEEYYIFAEADEQYRYAPAQIGYARDQMAYSDYPDSPYHGDQNASILTDEYGADVWLTAGNHFGDPTTPDVPNIRVTRGKKDAGKSFPEPGWRVNDEVIASASISSYLSSFLMGDTLRLTISIENLVNVTCSVANDDQGDGEFVTPVVVATTKGTGANWNSPIKEAQYPLYGCAAVAPSAFYSEIDFTLTGILDRNYVLMRQLSASLAIDHADGDSASAPTTGLGAPLTLSSLFKFSFIPVDTAGFSNSDREPNVANSRSLLGMPDEGFVLNTSGNAVPTANGSENISEEPFESSIQVELPDFNISGRNGGNGDSTKTIGVAAKQKLVEGDDTNIAHYEPPFPIPINLNLNHDKTLYAMNVALKRMDGTVANDLAHSSELVLLHDEATESKAARMLARQIAKVGEKQGNAFATAGQEFPRV